MTDDLIIGVLEEQTVVVSRRGSAVQASPESTNSAETRKDTEYPILILKFEDSVRSKGMIF